MKKQQLTQNKEVIPGSNVIENSESLNNATMITEKEPKKVLVLCD